MNVKVVCQNSNCRKNGVEVTVPLPRVHGDVFLGGPLYCFHCERMMHQIEPSERG